MRYFISIIILLLVCTHPTQTVYSQILKRSTEVSRVNSVRVIVPDFDSAGTGFFLDSMHIVTCFHVIAQIQIIDPSKGQVQWGIANNISVTINEGETIPASCISVPTEKDPSPLLHDFAILKLSRKPKVSRAGLPIYKEKILPDIGADIIFSGYPLGAPTMLTHKGYISGITEDRNLICIQASINKGNSGGALLTEKGEVIGIISNREGGISKGLADVRSHITVMEQGRTGVQTSVSLGGVNTLPVMKELIATLDKYISPGIGYAHSIKYLQEYLIRNPNLLK